MVFQHSPSVIKVVIVVNLFLLLVAQSVVQDTPWSVLPTISWLIVSHAIQIAKLVKLPTWQLALLALLATSWLKILALDALKDVWTVIRVPMKSAIPAQLVLLICFWQKMVPAILFLLRLIVESSAQLVTRCLMAPFIVLFVLLVLSWTMVSASIALLTAHYAHYPTLVCAPHACPDTTSQLVRTA